MITDSIRRQLVSDVPLCCFLSGGLDSSIISKIAADEYSAKNMGNLHTYSVDYVDNQSYYTKSIFQPNSDNKYIKLMSDAIGSEHHEIVLDNESLAQSLDNAVSARDLPEWQMWIHRYCCFAMRLSGISL